MKIRSFLRRYFLLCPIRHILTILGAAFIAVYFIFRDNKSAMRAIYRGLTKPYHRLMSKVCGIFGFSVAEVLIYIFSVGIIIYIIYCIVSLIGKSEKGKTAIRLVITLLCSFCLIYGGFCILWGVYYDTSSFEEESGIERRLISTEELYSVTHYFTLLTNYYADRVERDENGVFAESREEIFDSSQKLYLNTEVTFPCLEGEELRPKAFSLGKLLSYLDFTGFFFPFTAEANINNHSPSCMLPSTIAHELAHQRGVAKEDEANFVAVMASLDSGDDVYCYSACLMAYTYLGNALYSADYDAWRENYMLLSDSVKTDFMYKSEYWKQFETPAATVSNTVYESFLESYRQDLGLKTYGACVDMLVIYYLDAANAVNDASVMN